MKNILLRSTQSIFLLWAVMTPKLWLNMSMLFIFDLKTSKDVISLCEPAALSFVGFLKFFVYFFFLYKDSVWIFSITHLALLLEKMKEGKENWKSKIDEEGRIQKTKGVSYRKGTGGGACVLRRLLQLHQMLGRSFRCLGASWWTKTKAKLSSWISDYYFLFWQ